ncbi:unnamed protein product [Ectocarpus sp. 6 AP-2014]
MAHKERERAPRAPSKKPCRFFHQNDCFRGDKCHMVHVAKNTLAACQTHLFWLEDPWSRPACEWGEDCTFPHPKPEGPEDPGLLRTNVALQTESSQLSRVRAYASGVLGKDGEASDTGTARSGTSRYRQKLALLEARDPQEFSRRCVSDPSLCRSLLRVYLLGGGLCTSLEDVGKAVSKAVAEGKYPGGRPPPGTEDNTTTTPTDAVAGGATPPPPPPLCVRVQALPKVMEMQLIDEETTFWDDNFPNLSRERQAGAFTHVLSLVFARGAFLWGLAQAATHGRSIIDNNNENTAVCRAYYKIKEVTSRADLSFSEDWTAIDIGAAPGGWTSFLASKCRRVLSVDPAELDPAVLALPNVVHVQKLIEAAKGTLLDLLAEDAPAHERESRGGEGEERDDGGGRTHDGWLSGGGSFTPEASSLGSRLTPGGPVASAGSADTAGEASSTGANGRPTAPGKSQGAELLVSDMNAEPAVVADVLLSAMSAGLARPGALLVATFKDFCGRRKRMKDEVALAVERLRVGAAVVGGGVSGVEEGDGGPAAAPCGGGPPNAGTSGNDADGGLEAGNGLSHVGTPPEGRVARAACEKEGAEGWWRLEGIETMKLLAGGRAEVTIVARVAQGTGVTNGGDGGR